MERGPVLDKGKFLSGPKNSGHDEAAELDDNFRAIGAGDASQPIQVIRSLRLFAAPVQRRRQRVGPWLLGLVGHWARRGVQLQSGDAATAFHRSPKSSRVAADRGFDLFVNERLFV